MIEMITYLLTTGMALGSNMYWTSKSPKELVPLELRIFVTVMISSVVCLSGNTFKMSSSVTKISWKSKQYKMLLVNLKRQGIIGLIGAREDI